MIQRTVLALCGATLLSLPSMADKPPACEGAETTLDIRSNAPPRSDHQEVITMQGTFDRMDAGYTLTLKSKSNGAVRKSLKWQSDWSCEGYSPERKVYVLIGQSASEVGGRYDGFISQLSEDGTARELDLLKTGHFAQQSVVSPDRRYVAFLANKRPTDKPADRVSVVDLATLEIRDVGTGKRFRDLKFTGPAQLEAAVGATGKHQSVSWDLKSVFAPPPPITKSR